MKLSIQTPWSTMATRPVKKAFWGEAKVPKPDWKRSRLSAPKRSG